MEGKPGGMKSQKPKEWSFSAQMLNAAKRSNRNQGEELKASIGFNLEIIGGLETFPSR